jgi:N-acetylglucosamine-6-phosphate deacetylase
MYALTNGKIFTSEEVLETQTVLIEGDKISEIISEENLDPGIQVIDLKRFNPQNLSRNP